MTQLGDDSLPGALHAGTKSAQRTRHSRDLSRPVLPSLSQYRTRSPPERLYRAFPSRPPPIDTATSSGAGRQDGPWVRQGRTHLVMPVAMAALVGDFGLLPRTRAPERGWRGPRADRGGPEKSSMAGNARQALPRRRRQADAAATICGGWRRADVAHWPPTSASAADAHSTGQPLFERAARSSDCQVRVADGTASVLLVAVHVAFS